jgi:hypothetical protein
VRPTKGLYGRSWAKEADEWDEENAKWQAGWRPDYFSGADGDECRFYDQYAGKRPYSGDYMPDWPESERTHFQMYEDTTEGTPISPVFATMEDCARWCADNGASSFGSNTADYEYWLGVCRGSNHGLLMLNTKTGEMSVT